MKVSIYEFRNLRRVYAIVELEEEEQSLLDFLLSLDDGELRGVLEKVFGRLRAIKYGKGAYVGDSRVGFFYAEVELEDFSLYSLEVYPQALTLVADSSFSDLYAKVHRLVELPKAR